MTQPMTPADRQRWFIARVRANHHPNKTDIVREFDVSADTADRDVRHLKDDLGAPLVYRQRQRGYALSDPAWRMPATDTGVDPAVAIASARSLLDAFSPALAAELDAAVARMPDLALTPGHARALHVTTAHAVGRNSPWLHQLLDACAQRYRVRVLFSSPWRDDPPRPREVAPWLVQLHDGALYLHGYCLESRDHRCFSLSGISAVERVDGPCKAEPRSFRKDLSSTLGVGSGQKGEAEVVLRGAWANYAAHEVWHRDQVDQWDVEDAGGGARCLRRRFAFGLEVEAVRLLLGYGGGVEVRSPLTLRRALAAAFAAGAARNGPDGREVGARGG